MKMPFGKFAGKEVKDVPRHYLQWLHGEGGLYGGLKDAVEKVLGITPAPPSSMSESDGSEVAALKAEVARLNNQIKALETYITLLERENSELCQELGYEDVPPEEPVAPPPEDDFAERLRLHRA